VSKTFDVSGVRGQFPALARRVDGQAAVYFDGPAGSQVPQRVADAVARYLIESNGNTHGPFVTSIETDAMLDGARAAVADFLGAADPDCIAFGQNMTSLTFSLSRSLGLTWDEDDEVVVTRLDHDANVTPWVMAAADAGATVRKVDFRAEDCVLDMDAMRAAITEQTRLVAVGAASNATGTINPVSEIAALAHEVGALVFVDAVHYAPHMQVDVQAMGCDFLACSAYKFYGPHVGILWGRRDLLEELHAYQVRPADGEIPGRWMTGTQSHEGIAGTAEAIAYLAELGEGATRREALADAYNSIVEHERGLALHLLAGLAELPRVRVWGITDPDRIGERVPTVSITHETVTPENIARALAREGIFVWHGNYYAVEVTEALGLEPHGMVRIGLMHYNTRAEVDRLLDALRALG
jgi:cysteine desulfurase family protein (TIGR01976 family)